MAKSLPSWISKGKGSDRRKRGDPPPSHALEKLLESEPGGSRMQTPVLLPIVGKGGNGKTTVAASLGLGLAERGYRILIASVDPAHNLADVLETDLGPKPVMVEDRENLWAVEVDNEQALRNYLDRTSREVRHTYRYLQALNLERFLNTLRLAPGVEEQVAMEEVAGLLIRAGEEGFDALILDTPPTGLTMRVLALPTVSTQWAEQLQRVRREILKKREVIERVVGPEEAIIGDEKVRIPSSEQKDPVSRILKDYLSDTTGLRDLFADSERTGVVLVRHPDRISGLESERALADLTRLGIPLAMIVWNRCGAGEMQEMDSVEGAVRNIPLLVDEPIGSARLLHISGHLLSQ